MTIRSQERGGCARSKLQLPRERSRDLPTKKCEVFSVKNRNNKVHTGGGMYNEGSILLVCKLPRQDYRRLTVKSMTANAHLVLTKYQARFWKSCMDRNSLGSPARYH